MNFLRKLLVVVFFLSPMAATAEYVEWRFDLAPQHPSQEQVNDGFAIVGFDDQDFRFPPIVRLDFVIVSRLISHLYVEIDGQTFNGAPTRLPPYFGAIGVQQWPNYDHFVIDADLDNGGQFHLTIQDAPPSGTLFPYYGFLEVPTPLGDFPDSQLSIQQHFVRILDEFGSALYGRYITRWGPAPEPVTIDIKPGEISNDVNPTGKQKISVAILTTNTFDAIQVDWETVLFGPDGATESHGRAHVKDVDGDGYMDILLHFNTQDTGIACGDTEATLTGETFGGEPISGSDSIVTVKCD